MEEKRKVLVIAGPNGAGKTTFATEYLLAEASVPRFVNVDLIASGLSPFDPSSVQFRAGRLMLERMTELTRIGESFAIETTLSGRLYERWIHKWQDEGFFVEIHFLYLDSDDLAISRVQERVQAGGHSVPIEIVRRRYRKGWRNFEEIYRDLVDEWIVYDTSAVVPVLRGASEQGLNASNMQEGDRKSRTVEIEAAVTAICRAANVAHQRAAQRHGKIAISQDGKVVWIEPIVDK